MARPTTAPPTKKSAISTRKPGRPTATPANTPAKRPKVPAAAKPTRTVASPAAPKLGKDELRTRVEALERANTTLRAKNRDADRAAKTAAAQSAELEDQVAQLEKRVAAAQRKAE